MIRIVIAVIMSFAWAVNLSVLWGWFVVPLGVVSIGWAHALGLNTLVWAFTHDELSWNLEGVFAEEDSDARLWVSAGMCVLTFVLGWFAYLMMLS